MLASHNVLWVFILKQIRQEDSLSFFIHEYQVILLENIPVVLDVFKCFGQQLNDKIGLTRIRWMHTDMKGEISKQQNFERVVFNVRKVFLRYELFLSCSHHQLSGVFLAFCNLLFWRRQCIKHVVDYFFVLACKYNKAFKHRVNFLSYFL